MIDLSSAVIVHPPGLSGPENRAIDMLVEEVEKRSRIIWTRVSEWSGNASPAIVIGRGEALKTFAGIWKCEFPGMFCSGKPPEGYSVRTVDGDAPIVIVSGNDNRGVLFGVGHLLRKLEMGSRSVILNEGLNVTSTPRYRLRGHMLGYWDKSNTYCGWGLGQFEQYIRDLVVFGTNAVELIPPNSGDKPRSIHFPIPPLDMIEGISYIANAYDLDVWIWYPVLVEDFDDPKAVESALLEREGVFSRLSRIDAIFVPGGDPGKTPPRILMRFLEMQKGVLQKHHPEAELWVSPQGFSDEWMQEFLGILKEEPDWLDGVVFGPTIHMSTEEFRDMIPEKYPIRHYPDITHSLSCQYPVPGWDIAYALTEGREPINPRPTGHGAIFRYTQPPTIGFSTYSEGCNDDVNKIVWSSLGWDPERDIQEVLGEYSRYFIGAGQADDFARGLLALERNWVGPLAENSSVYDTLKLFQSLEKSVPPSILRNWRFQQALYRAYYDAYVRSRLLHENELEKRAMAKLGQATSKGPLPAMKEAENILDSSEVSGELRYWRTRIFQLAEALFQSIHMKLSVDLYRAQSEDRGANLDSVDYPLNNAPWLRARFSEIRELGDEESRLEAIREILEWTNPGPGGFYENLGSSTAIPSSPESLFSFNRHPHSHVVFGKGLGEDPGFWKTPFRQYPHWKNPKPIPLAWRGCTGTLKDTPFEMRYSGLDPDSTYRVRIVYSDLSPEIKVRLEANNHIQIHPWIARKDAPLPKEFDIPHEATREGTLTLRWQREPGKGGTGRGCQISEIWLMKNSAETDQPATISCELESQQGPQRILISPLFD